MTDLALRPRSSTELVDASFQVFRRTPVQFIVAAALVYVPWLVIQLVFDLEIQSDQLPDFDVLGINLLAGIVVYVILGGVIALLARDAYFDQPPDVARAFRTVGARVLPLLGVSLVVLVTTFIALIFLILPALYPLSRFFCARQAVVLERAGVGTALSRSSTLSSGLKGHILSTLLLAGLTFAVNVMGWPKTAEAETVDVNATCELVLPTLNVKLFVADAPAASTALTVKETVPVAVGTLLNATAPAPRLTVGAVMPVPPPL